MLLILFITILLIFVCVVIHYEALYRFDGLCQLMKIRGRIKVAAGSIWVLIAHTLEVWLFGLSYYVLVNNIETNSLVSPQGEVFQSFMDSVYFSFISYSSLGYGDVVPAGPIRFMAGTEALVGLVLIAWSASFLYLKMETNWNKN